MSRIAKPHRIVALAVVTALAAAAPASADGLKHRYSAADSVVAATCGGPSDIIECAPPVESKPQGGTPVRPA